MANKTAKTETLSDDLNPAYIFTLTATALLSKIAKGEINAQDLAKRELENRGVDIDGRWVGFDNKIQ